MIKKIRKVLLVIMIEYVDDVNWNISDEGILPKRKFVCGLHGCTKSYSNRQNCYRHKMNEHSTSLKSKTIESAVVKSSRDLQERDILIETFSSLYTQFGEEEATKVLRRNCKLREHLIPLRKIMEADINERQRGANASQSHAERQLLDFHNAFPDDENSAFTSVIRLVKEATPASIVHLKEFTKVISTLIDHISDHTESMNPKFQQSLALKKVLDELFIEEREKLGIPVEPTPPPNLKRKAAALTSTVSVDLGPEHVTHVGQEGLFTVSNDSSDSLFDDEDFGELLNRFIQVNEINETK